jgi:hypothetical protein
MPWFITAVGGVNCSRTFGFFNTYGEAYKEIRDNGRNLQECLYEYLVLEYIEPGIHSQVHKAEWWKWTNYEYNDDPNDTRVDTWEVMSYTPEQFVHLTNWAVG